MHKLALVLLAGGAGLVGWGAWELRAAQHKMGAASDGEMDQWMYKHNDDPAPRCVSMYKQWKKACTYVSRCEMRAYTDFRTYWVDTLKKPSKEWDDCFVHVHPSKTQRYGWSPNKNYMYRWHVYEEGHPHKTQCEAEKKRFEKFQETIECNIQETPDGFFYYLGTPTMDGCNIDLTCVDYKIDVWSMSEREEVGNTLWKCIDQLANFWSDDGGMEKFRSFAELRKFWFSDMINPKEGEIYFQNKWDMCFKPEPHNGKWEFKSWVKPWVEFCYLPTMMNVRHILNKKLEERNLREEFTAFKTFWIEKLGMTPKTWNICFEPAFEVDGTKVHLAS